MTAHQVSRRLFLSTGGALVVGFAISPSFAQPQPQQPAQNAQVQPNGGPPLPGSLQKAPYLDAWIAIDAKNGITVFTGKAELGQGIKTALIQCAAEQLNVDFTAIKLVTADTERTPNEGYTAGSHSMQDSGTAILNAAAQVRAILLDLAAARFNVPADQLKVQAGKVSVPDGRSASYGELVAGQDMHRMAQPTSPLKDPKDFAVMGKPVPRIDIPGKLTGGAMYVQDIRMDGMLHARVVRPPGYGAQLVEVNTAQVQKMPGVVNVVRDGSFLAVVAEGEFQAIEAMNALSAVAQWRETAQLPGQSDIHKHLESLPTQDQTIDERGNPNEQGARVLKARYTRPYLSHGSIGPSCAVALYHGGKLTIWTHTQGVYPLRNTIANMVHLPDGAVRCIHVEGAGCYGQNGADDVAGDVAVIARAMPGKPIRLQWMREQEHGWEPYGPAQSANVSAALDGSGKIVAWNYEVWSNTHSTRPEGPPGVLVPAQYLAQPFKPPPPRPLPMPEGGGDRNAIPIYTIANSKVVYHFIPEMPIRVSALRSLGAPMNIFAIESFMDELADAAKTDPVEFRLKHLGDPRARDVIDKAVQEFGWKKDAKLPRGQGHGFAFARYKNLAAYCAIAMEVNVEHETGAVRIGRVVAAVDSGQAVNPDGIRNQVEGAIVQSASWALYEAVTFDNKTITSRDWSSYPIARFSLVPASIDVHVIDRPGEPFLGTGECGQAPAQAAIANGIARATGVRLRDMPLTRAKIKQAIGV
jgi:CO/xanthine dehydrogenase Mo-binding subunit